jgi:hypothetical protein
MRIALFSSFSPEIGGGSVPLRGHLQEMTDLDIHWYYLAPSPVQRERTYYLGRPLSDLQLAGDLAARTGLPGSSAAVRRVVDELQADLFWVVGHYEGVSVAAELLRRGKPVHLTVHDDPVCMFKRSRRYRLLTPLMAGLFSKVITRVKSADVISRNMRDVYLQKYKVESFPVYRYVSALPKVSIHPPESTSKTLLVGHIGSVYHPNPFRAFLRACRNIATERNRALKVLRVGTSPELDEIARENPSLFENKSELTEDQAIPVLASCDLVYAMYPAGSRFECFRRTSMPMKLSTYIQAQRPIFAHAPADSGLAQVVSQFSIGQVCSSESVEMIRTAIAQSLDSPVEPQNFETARQDLMGRQQIDRLRLALSQ